MRAENVRGKKNQYEISRMTRNRNTNYFQLEEKIDCWRTEKLLKLNRSLEFIVCFVYEYVGNGGDR